MKKIILLLFLSIQAFSQIETIENFPIFGNKITGNKTVFSRNTPDYGNEIWVSDGAPNNARLLKDIIVGPESSNPVIGYEFNGLVYFIVNGSQIWRTDGTTNGTYAMVVNSAVTAPSDLVQTGQFIFFKSGGQLYKMLGTPNSESLVNTSSEFSFTQISAITKLDDDEVIFNARLSRNGAWGIYRSNGVVIQFITDINQGTGSLEREQMRRPKNIDNTIYFDGYTSTTGGELWKTTGSSTGTELVLDIFTNNTNPFTGGSGPRYFTKMGDNIYFSAFDGINGWELWKTNGTAAGTMIVRDITNGNNSDSGPDAFLLPINNFLYFSQNISNNPGNTQIYKTDGTESGTIKITDLPDSYLSLTEMFLSNTSIYFSYNQPSTGQELWKLNTLDDTYSMIADIATGTLSGSPGNFFELNGFVYFSATDNGLNGGLKFYRIANQSLSNATIDVSTTKIYPNPTTTILTIDIQNTTNFEFEIYSVVGKKVANYSNQKSIDIAHLNSGLYLIKIIDKEHNKTTFHKILKK